MIYIYDMTLQGDEEKSRGLTPMPMMDRDRESELPQLEVSNDIVTVCLVAEYKRSACKLTPVYLFPVDLAHVMNKYTEDDRGKFFFSNLSATYDVYGCMCVRVTCLCM